MNIENEDNTLTVSGKSKYHICTLGVQINVLAGKLVRNNKHTGPNKGTDGKFLQKRLM